LLGLVLGVAGMLWGPRLVEGYLPGVVAGKTTPVTGEVVKKQREPDRLLFTLVPGQGAILVTVTRKISETNLLVDEGDTVTLGLRRYQPFAENPRIERVEKRKPPA
jgi:hypothetical protein